MRVSTVHVRGGKRKHDMRGTSASFLQARITLNGAVITNLFSSLFSPCFLVRCAAANERRLCVLTALARDFIGTSTYTYFCPGGGLGATA